MQADERPKLSDSDLAEHAKLVPLERFEGGQSAALNVLLPAESGGRTNAQPAPRRRARGLVLDVSARDNPAPIIR